MGVAAARVAPALAFALLLVLAGVGAGAAAGPEAGHQPAVRPAGTPVVGPAQTTPGGAPPETTTVLRINLRADGDARWNVTTVMALDTAVDREAFDRLAEEHETDDLDALSTTPFENAAEKASQVTGRPMAIEDVARNAARGGDSGRLSLRFTWANFTRTEGSEIRLGDAFQTPSGTWLPGLGTDQVLVIEFPAGYTVRDSSRRLTNGTIRVEGPATFEPGRPSAVLRETGGGLPQNGLATEEILGLVVGVAVLVGGVVYLLTRRRRRRPTDTDGDTGPGDEVAGADGEAPEPAPAGAMADGSAHTESPDPADAGAGVEPSGEEPTDEPLLSDEERVERLLTANGGRMKQVDIVAETGWSNAKVSQLLSAMDEDGRVEKLRIGRENLISLPEDDRDER